MYEQCMDMDTLEQTGLTLWNRFVEELGGWMPELNDGSLDQEEQFEIEADEETKKKRRFEVEDIILSAFNYSVFPLFWAGVEVNYLDSKEHLITVTNIDNQWITCFSDLRTAPNPAGPREIPFQ